MSLSLRSAPVESSASIAPATPNRALSQIEQADLAQCEQVIRSGLKTYKEVGAALAEIKNQKLYRAQYGTFAAYCDAVWGWTDRHARRMIVASRESESGPIGPVANEAQQRELNRLPAKDRTDAWSEAVKATGGKVTAKALKAAVDKRMPPSTDKIVDGRGQPVVARLRPAFEARLHFLAVRVDLVWVQKSA